MSQLGSGWTNGTAGRHPVERLDGLGMLAYAIRGRLLFVSDDVALLAAMLDRSGNSPAEGALTYAAGFRHLRGRPNYERIMAALDFTAAADAANAPPFFSANIGSLSRVLSGVAEVRVTEQERDAVTIQIVQYRMSQ